MYSIYEIRCGGLTKVYVGMTNNYNRRISAHKTALKHGTHPCKELQLDYDNIKILHRYVRFYKVAEAPDKETAEVLESIFIYKHLAHKEKVYNQVKTTYFPGEALNLNNEYVNSLIDDGMILYAYYTGNIGNVIFERLCVKLGREYLLDIVQSKSGGRHQDEILVC